MNRRTFLKAIGIGSLAAWINPLTIFEWNELRQYPWFNPNLEYGDYAAVSDLLTEDVLKDYKALLDDQIGESIPPSFRHKIRYFGVNPRSSINSDPLGQKGYFGWKYSPKPTGKLIQIID